MLEDRALTHFLEFSKLLFCHKPTQFVYSLYAAIHNCQGTRTSLYHLYSFVNVFHRANLLNTSSFERCYSSTYRFRLRSNHLYLFLDLWSLCFLLLFTLYRGDVHSYCFCHLAGRSVLTLVFCLNLLCFGDSHLLLLDLEHIERQA